MVELRGVEPRPIPFKTIGIKHFCVVRVHFRVHFKYNTAEAGRLIPTPAVLLHLAALLCQYSTARLGRRQVFSAVKFASARPATAQAASVYFSHKPKIILDFT